MPLFDFKCPDCGKIREYVLVHKGDKPIVCECGTEMKKRIGAPNLGNMDSAGRSRL